MTRPLALLAFVVGPLLAGSHAMAQEPTVISGVVTTKDDGLPLPGATVAIQALKLEAVTGSDGGYSLTVPAGAPQSVEIRVSATGLRPQVQTLTLTGAGLTADFALALGFHEEVVVGSRASGAEAEKAVPVDILTAKQIEQTGFTETMEVIKALAPSFNFPRTTIADGSSTVRPATLRGLGPDQVLVLINGKRRHTTALVHVNATVGRGSTGVDLNAIPVSAIERVEVLRDGAAAQYGSDAIAGVINIVLKHGPSPVTLGVKGGLARSGQGVGDTVTDGERIDASATYGFSLGRGWVMAAAEFLDRNRTNRAGRDTRDQVRPGDANNNPVAQPNHWVGDPETRDVLTFVNAQLPTNADETTYFYAFGGWGGRDGTLPGFYRRGLDVRNHPAIYPLGFLPVIQTDSADASGTVGLRSAASTWVWDVSAQYGRNSMDFAVTNSHNASLGPTIPPNQTDFYAGTYIASQLLGNVDVSRPFEIGLAGPVNVALGLEFRRETYQILAGEEASYLDGGFPDQFGGRAAPGAQVFPGLRPSNEIDESRSNFAAYVDVEGDVASKLRIGVAGRVEDYTDFGGTADGKLTVRFSPSKRFVIRGAASTGFRAPSLAQSFFSATSTNFINLGAGLVPVDVGTFAVNSPQAQALGATPLKAEQSVHYSGGVVLTPVDNFDITADFYKIDIDDRIVFSGNFTGGKITELLRPFGTNAARFFTNAIDTRTRGVDVTANYRTTLGGAGTLRFQAAFNTTDTNIVGSVTTPPILIGFENVLFDREQRQRIECSQPKNSLRLSGDWENAGWAAGARVGRYGTYCNPTNIPANDQSFGVEWVTDLDLSYRLDRMTLGVGVQNVFDTFPDQVILANSINGITRYATTNAFGVNGRFLYAKLVYRF